MTAMSRPAVRVNQLGYLPGAPQQATLVTDATAPLEFTVGGWRGWSRPWPPDPTSGLAVHVLDFTAADVRGEARITVGAEESHPFRVAPDVYEGLAADALGFFRRMRCAHPDTAVAAWTGPDAERLYPGWHPTGRFDVSGGWYDAGDYGKYVVSGSLPAWQLLDVAPQECRWQLDWMLRMLVPAGQPFAGMAFHRVHGTEWSPLPGLPHEDPTTRVLHRPSTAATLHVAAVAAVAARTFAGTPYAARLLAVRPVGPTRPRTGTRGWSPRTTRAASAAAPTATTGSTTTSTGPPRSCGWPRASDRSSPSSWRAPTTPATCSTSRGSTSTASLRPPASTSLWWRARCRTATGCGRASWRRASACWRCRPTSRGGSRTRRRGLGLGLERADPQQPRRARRRPRDQR